MHDKFTERVRKVIYLAREEAARLQHDYIGTEHLLLGVIREGEGIAATVLNNLGLDLDRIRQEVENMVSASGGTMTIGEIPFTPRAKRVLELAVEEARSLGHNYVGTEHLLLGLIREGEGVAAQVLLELGVDRKRVRVDTLKLLGGTPSSGQAAERGEERAETPALNQFGRDLTTLAREGKLDPVIGRENEIERVIQVLSRRKKNNPVLSGEPGVGRCDGGPLAAVGREVLVRCGRGRRWFGRWCGRWCGRWLGRRFGRHRRVGGAGLRTPAAAARCDGRQRQRCGPGEGRAARDHAGILHRRNVRWATGRQWAERWRGSPRPPPLARRRPPVHLFRTRPARPKEVNRHGPFRCTNIGRSRFVELSRSAA